MATSLPAPVVAPSADGDARLVAGGLADVPGFRCGGLHVGIKRKRPDLALLVSDGPTASGGVFTRNLAAAAPVGLSRDVTRAGHVRAVIVNSGCANACTGDQGDVDAKAMVAATARALGIDRSDVAVCSTGVIGRHLPMHAVVPGIDAVAAHVADGSDDGGFATAIMTTDTVPKEVLVETTINGRTVRIGGAAKGSGMIHPNMATMLAFLATDAPVAPDVLQRVVEHAADATFNMVSVDGDTSTNDAVIALAGGAAGGPTLDADHPDLPAFEHAFTLACTTLARAIAADGEGATTLITTTVAGAASRADARVAARAVVASPLVKTAVTGRDPNWGRIVSAVGASGANVDLTHVDLVLKSAKGEAPVLVDGQPVQGADLDQVRTLMDAPEVTIHLDLHQGDGTATAWGCDLTHAYVDINALYTT